MANRFLVAGVGGTKNWSDTSIWSDSDGGATGFSAPGINDKLIGTAASLSGALILTLDSAISIGEIDTSALDNNLTITGSVYGLDLYGNLTESGTYSLYNMTGTSYLTIKGNCTILTNGRATHSFNRLIINGVGITATNGDNMTIGATPIYLTNGTWDHANFNVTTTGEFQTASGTKALTQSSDTFKVGAWNNANPTNFTFNYNTGTVEITNTSTLSGVTTFYNLKFTGLSAVSAVITMAANITVSGTFTPAGNNSTNYRLLVASNTIGTPRTITCNGTIVASNVDFRDITLAGTANRDLSAITGGSGDCGGNSGITFTPAQKQYFKHTSGAVNFSNAAKWFSDFSPRTTAGRVPLPQDDWDFDAASFAGTSTVTVDCPRIGRSCDMSGVNQAVTLSPTGGIECYGSYITENNIIGIPGFNMSFLGKSNHFIKTTPNTQPYRYIIYGGIYTLLSDIVPTSFEFNIISGTIYFNDFNITGGIGFGSNTIIYWGNGTITHLGGFYGYGTWYMQGSTFKINVTGSSDNEFYLPTNQVLNKLQISGSGSGNLNYRNSSTIAELIIDPGRKVRFTAGTTQNIAKITLAGTFTWGSITNATHTINYTGIPVVYGGAGTVSYSIVSQTNKLFAGAGGTDGGNNTNWVFGTPVLVTPAFTESEILAATILVDQIVKIIAAFLEAEEQSSVLSANGFVLPEFTEAEIMDSVLNANAFAEAEFTDYEEIDTLLLALAKLITAFIEDEDLEVNLMAMALISANMTEAEILYSELMAMASIIIDLSEVEEMDVNAHIYALIAANFTETEQLFIRNYEKISGQSKFTNLISGQSKFTNLISGQSKFTNLISGQSKFK